MRTARLAPIPVVLVFILSMPSVAHSLTDEERCEVRAVKAIGNYARCLSRQLIRSVRRAEPVDTAPCDVRFDAALLSLELQFPGACPDLDALGLPGHLASCVLDASDAVESGEPIAPAQCGNGVLEGAEECEWGVLVETCQDLGFAHGTLDCSIGQCTFDTTGCGNFRTIFVTSTLVRGDVNIGGADAECEARADNAGLEGTFKAWISGTPSTFGNARIRNTHSPFPYVRVDGVMVAVNWDDLVDGQLLAPINITEHGVPVTSSFQAWTGTLPDGAEAELRCGDFINGHVGTSGIVGDVNSTGTAWSNIGSARCNTSHRLYCLEQDPEG